MYDTLSKGFVQAFFEILFDIACVIIFLAVSGKLVCSTHICPCHCCTYHPILCNQLCANRPHLHLFSWATGFWASKKSPLRTNNNWRHQIHIFAPRRFCSGAEIHCKDFCPPKNCTSTNACKFSMAIFPARCQHVSGRNPVVNHSDWFIGIPWDSYRRPKTILSSKNREYYLYLHHCSHCSSPFPGQIKNVTWDMDAWISCWKECHFSWARKHEQDWLHSNMFFWQACNTQLRQGFVTVKDLGCHIFPLGPYGRPVAQIKSLQVEHGIDQNSLAMAFLLLGGKLIFHFMQLKT